MRQRTWVRRWWLEVAVLGTAATTAGELATPSGCAAGTEPQPVGGSGGVVWTTGSAGGGTGGTGGVGGGTGSGAGGSGASGALGGGGEGGGAGEGGIAGSGGTAGSGGEGGGGQGGTGGAPGGTVVVFAGGSGALLGAQFTEKQGWTTKSISGGTDAGISLGPVGAGGAVAVYKNWGDKLLRYALWNATGWGAPTGIAPQLTTLGMPHLSAYGGKVDLSFLGENHKHYFGRYDGTKWSPTAELVSPSGLPQDQSYGPNPAAIALLATETAVAFGGDDGNLYDQRRLGSGWKKAVAVTGSTALLTPALVAPSAGPELMVVFVRKNDGKLMYSLCVLGSWSAPQPVEAGSYAADPPSLVALAGGRAALVFRGLDGKAYSSRYDPNGKTPWSTPAVPIATPNPAVPSTPALGPGVGAADAELVYIDQSDGAAYHERLAGSTWSKPTKIGGGALGYVAVTAVE